MKKIFYYRDFGAKGDGVTNDFEAIRLTHEAANAEGADVEATPGATYYIGCTYTSAVIRTNVDWKDAIFYIVAVNKRIRRADMQQPGGFPRFRRTGSYSFLRQNKIKIGN